MRISNLRFRVLFILTDERVLIQGQSNISQVGNKLEPGNFYYINDLTGAMLSS